jgi:hypothetical protein
MTPSSRLLRTLTAAVVLVAAAMPGAAVVLANGIGDLYAGQPAGVAELYLKDEKQLTVVALDKEPTTLAFTPDGAGLYAGDGRKMLVRIVIEDLSIADSFSLTADVAAIAHPKGDKVFLAVPSEDALSVIADGESAVQSGPALEGPADLVAADRHDYHVVAAQSGKTWVDVVDSVSNTVAKVDAGGKVIALTVASDDGVAFAVTSSPNQVVAIDLAKGDVAWTAALADKPTDVTWAGTESPRMAIVSLGNKTLVWARDGKTASWTTLEATPDVLATADEGAYVYAATRFGVTTVTVADPTAQPPAEIVLDKEPKALAPIPKTSSLSKTGGQVASSGSGSGGQAGNGSTTANEVSPSKAPATDTNGGSDGRFHPAGPDPVMLFGGAAVIALIVVAGMRGAISKWMQEP